ncbi:MAG: hypothetical protein R3350_08400 [Saprospiraceae bacterium]|nr:hypothetical protein [Saprospiraceae bacterium]
MGIFWELMQESKMEDQKKKAESLEERVEQLEKQLERSQRLLAKTLIALEEHIGKDIDGDEKIGE